MTAILDRPPDVASAPAPPAPSPVAASPTTQPDAPALPVRPVRVFRLRRGDPGPHWDRFDVPVASARMTVLDALTWIRAHLDPTLDVRHSCFHASCGTCGMRVNGRDVLGCVTRLDEVAAGVGEVTVEPLFNQPVVSDLVVHLEALYESFEAVGMPLVREADAVDGGHPAPGVERLTRFEDCIECGICLSACPVAATDPAYVGPGVLAAAWRVIEEPRDADPDRAFALVDGDQGAWRCHLAFECSEACPTDALPGEQIMHLRRGLLRHRLREVFGGGSRADGSGT